MNDYKENMVNQMKLSKKEYEAALKIINAIFNQPEEKQDLEKLDRLSKLVEAYEKIHYPIPKPTKKELKEFRKSQEISPFQERLTSKIYTLLDKELKPDIIVEDLKLEKADALILQPIKEADLKGHISNPSATPDTSTNTSATDTNDYQLSQALNILKALHFANITLINNIKQ